MYRTPADVYWQAQLAVWGPRILIALLILLATWIVARAVKWALAKAVSRTPALQKHTPGNQHETVGDQLGTIAKLIVWLVGIMAALQYLNVGQILQPINTLTNDALDPFAKIPEFKYCEVRVTPGGEPPRQSSYGGGQILEEMDQA